MTLHVREQSPVGDECGHPEKAMRFKVDALGRRFYLLQCLVCGEPASSALKKPEDATAIQPWDAALQDRCRATRDAGYDARHAERESRLIRLSEDRAARKAAYEAHLQSETWRQMRQLVIQRDGGLCQGCLQAPGQHVHHLTYDRVGRELAFDLILLCEACHERAHPWKEKA